MKNIFKRKPKYTLTYHGGFNWSINNNPMFSVGSRTVVQTSKDIGELLDRVYDLFESAKDRSTSDFYYADHDSITFMWCKQSIHAYDYLYYDIKIERKFKGRTEVIAKETIKGIAIDKMIQKEKDDRANNRTESEVKRSRYV